MSTTPTAIYVRLSQDKLGDGLGVQRQETECMELARRMGLTVVDVYSDNDTSATSGKPRPGYLRMLADIKAGRIEAVVAWHTDRLHRSPIELEDYINAGALTYTVQAGPLDLATASGRMAARTYGAVAKYEVEQKAERQKAKNRQSAQQGRMPSGPLPFGYNDDRQTVHPEQGAMIREAYKALLGGASLGSVIKAWNASEHRAPRGGRWTYSTVRGVLLRAMNAGLVQYDGVVLAGVAGLWEPLVAEDDYYALKALLADPKRRTTTGRERKHLLVGLLTCQSCGMTMKSGMTSSRGKKSELYRCANPSCTKPIYVAREKVNELVVERFLAERGHLRTARLVTEDNGAALADVEARIAGLTARLGDDEADVAMLMQRLAELKSERALLRSSEGVLSLSHITVAQEWEKCSTVAEKASLLASHLLVLSVAPRGKVSHRFDPERVTIAWSDLPSITLDGQPTDTVLPAGRTVSLYHREVPKTGTELYSWQH
jgi:site-specific DNA recombinase